MNTDTTQTPMKWRRVLNDEIIEKGDRRFSIVDPNLPPIAVEEWWIGKTAIDSNVHEFETTRPWPMHLEVGALRGKIEKLETELDEKTNEVAMLIRENAKLRDALETYLQAGYKEARRLASTKAKAALAPEPEEPVTHPLMNCQVCGELRGHGHECKIPAPKWRELGKDEVICEGDEEPKDGGGWMPVLQCYVGKKAKGRVYPVRTHRPLPVREEKWFPVNPPLEKELNYIEHRGTSLPDSRRYIADAIRYLRDEIQKLKEAR